MTMIIVETKKGEMVASLCETVFSLPDAQIFRDIARRGGKCGYQKNIITDD